MICSPWWENFSNGVFLLDSGLGVRMLPDAASEPSVPGGLGVPTGSNVPESPGVPVGLVVACVLGAAEGLDVPKVAGVPVGRQSWD